MTFVPFFKSARCRLPSRKLYEAEWRGSRIHTRAPGPGGAFLMKGLGHDESSTEDVYTKVPKVTLLFWVMKIAATTLGETGGDAVSMSLHLGYLVSTGIFAAVFAAAVAAQIAAKGFNPYLYWTAIIATTTVGTTLADFADRSLGIGYAGGAGLLSALLLLTFFAWHRSMGSISVETVATPKAEAFYWTAIMFSQTLGTALGDWMADDAGFGYLGAAGVVGIALLGVVLAYYRTRVSRALLFWIAFVLTRPLGATLGDFLDKPLTDGGLALSRFSASASLILFIIACIVLFRHPAASKAH